MKTKHNKSILTTLALASTLLASSAAFAVNPYGMEYTGGEPLGADNVQIEPGLIDSLAPIIRINDDKELTFSDSDLWQDGYTSINGCTAIKYITINQDIITNNLSNVYYTIANRRYTAKVDIKNIGLKNDGDSYVDGRITVAVYAENKLDRYGDMLIGYQVYSDSECQDVIGNTRWLYPSHNSDVFVNTKITLEEKNGEGDLGSKQLFFGITDIDGAQSYKILNQDSKLTLNNMYAKSAEALQPTDSGLRNMYVADGSYIYSQYDGRDFFDIATDSDIYAKLGQTAIEDGLEMVFGFAAYARSGIQFYAQQYTVTYRSDSNGAIAADSFTSEDVMPDDTPSGVSTTPKEGYELKYWTADRDVVLKDGTTIKAGEHILPGQVKQVVVGGNIVFTAHHELVPEDSTDPEKPDEPGDETKPDDSGKPDYSAKPDDKSEPKDEENSNVEVPDTGKNTGEFSSGGLELIGSVVTGIVVAAVLMGVYKTRQSKRRMWYN